MTSRPEATVVVLNYNGARHLEGCLEALVEQGPPSRLEILVVDNGSPDGSARAACRRHPRVRLVEAGRNLGFAGGNNLGIREAAGEHLVLLNNDTRVRPGWLEALLGAVGPEVGAVTSKLLFADRPDTVQNAGLVLLADGGGADRGAGRPEASFEVRERVFGFCGAAALLTRPMLADVGLLDPTFFMYYEDADLSWRMRLRGWEVLFEPRARVDHVHAASSVEGSRFFHFHADRNRLFMLVKNASWPTAARCLAATAAAARHPAAGAAQAAPRPLRAAGISLALHMPEMLAKRAAIRARRRVPDSAITALMVPRERWLERSV